MSTTPPVMASELRTPFRFTNERLLKFVELYSREPCLWNRRPYISGARNSAYKRLQAGINDNAEPNEIPLTLESIKVKIKNLRTSYHQELKKMAANSKYTPRAIWFAPFNKFLAPVLNERTNGSSILDTPEPPPLKRLQIKLTRLKTCKAFIPRVKMELEPDEQVVIPKSVLPLNRASPPPLSRILPPPSPIPDPTQPSDTNAASTNTSQNLPILPNMILSEDEFTFFGLSVAAQLRSMPLTNAMIMQSKIQTMLSTERCRIGGIPAAIE
ncbi:uncharacterized protein LOC108596397 isoform X2 [Drosophila busckii]|uniref:uncharacterized protein LOC108596397 isoform X2 n=1 Tax=Drosophila busckii TaxID=30019 RepID=UPI00083EA934|nr:uncharacterized protein LOC108596397 isoform X2 [Drosophila busckii]